MMNRFEELNAAVQARAKDEFIVKLRQFANSLADELQKHDAVLPTNEAKRLLSDYKLFSDQHP